LVIVANTDSAQLQQANTMQDALTRVHLLRLNHLQEGLMQL